MKATSGVSRKEKVYINIHHFRWSNYPLFLNILFGKKRKRSGSYRMVCFSFKANWTKSILVSSCIPMTTSNKKQDFSLMWRNIITSSQHSLTTFFSSRETYFLRSISRTFQVGWRVNNSIVDFGIDIDIRR